MWELLQENTALQTIEQTATTKTMLQGVVFRKSLGRYDVHAGDETVACSVSSKLHKHLLYPTADAGSLHPRVVAVMDIQEQDPIAIGDRVHFLPAGDRIGMIMEVMPRSSVLSRRAAGAKPLEQIMAVNAGWIVPVIAAARPAPSWELLDRYLAAAEQAEVPACIAITKMDLVDRNAFEAELSVYRRAGYRVIATSAETGAGIEELRALLSGQISVLTGKSGVGKTSLLNAVQPGLGLRVGEVGRATNKGKHTTTHLEMFPLHGGGSIVDTPGMREFGLWNVHAGEVASLFPELRPLVGTCRFGMGCSHRHEPSCAIRAAVEQGIIPLRRYKSALSLAESLPES